MNLVAALLQSHAAVQELWLAHIERDRLDRTGATVAEHRACDTRLNDAWTAVGAAKVAVDAARAEPDRLVTFCANELADTHNNYFPPDLYWCLAQRLLVKLGLVKA